MKQELLEHLIRHCIREVISQIKKDDSQYQLNESMDSVFTLFKPINQRLVQILMDTNQGTEFYFDPKNPTTLRIRSTHSNEFNSAKKNTEDLLSKSGIPFSVNRSLEEQDDETKGAAAPPADGQGTADQPAIPKEDPTQEPPAASETPEAPPAPDMKGVVFVNPKDKAKLIKVPIQAQGDAGIERSLHQQAARLAGSRVKVALPTSRMVKDVLHNPNTSVYLYLGKYDPESDEVFLMADKSLQVAKDSSVSPGELTGAPVTALAPTSFHPLTADPGEYAHQLAAGGKVQATGIDENLQRVIKKVVNEILDKR